MSEKLLPPKVLMASCGGWYLPQSAKALENRGALAELWITEKNSERVREDHYRRCWPFHIAMKPLYHLGTQLWAERAFYLFFPIWRAWVRAQQLPKCNVVHAIMGYCTELFDRAEKIGALKVLDCPNTHPTTYFGNWQRECDLWCPGENVPIPRWMFARMNREIARADMIVVQSNFGRETMVSNGVPPRKIMVNPMGVNLETFRKRECVPDRPCFIAVGTICLRKGHQYLFRAFQIVKQTLPDAELICVGDYKADFRRERPRWEGTFTHYPHLPHAKVAEMLGQATAFVFPSQEEGIARAQMEALACGLPLIGTHAGGATTVVDDGKEGRIISGNDPQELADAMIQLAKDREFNARMGAAAYAKGGRHNSWQDYGDRLLEEYARHLRQ